MFEWNPAYSVKVGSIDSQHRGLLELGGELSKAMATGQGKAVAGKILNRLIQYTGMHFAHDERLMMAHGYPGFAAHKAQHDALVAKVVQFEADFKAGRVAISVELLDFLRDWLIGHIQGSDQKYAPYLREKAVA
jgi:hemerythrin-like metal-binding protein